MQLGLGFESSKVLCSIIAANPNIAQIDFTKNCLENEGAILLSRELAVTRSIVRVCLSNNGLGKAGGEALVNSLAYNQSIVDFDISSLDGM